MDQPIAPAPIDGHAGGPDRLERLGRHVADLAVAVGDHASLLASEIHVRMARILRESLFSLAFSAAAVLASVVGYGLLVR